MASKSSSERASRQLGLRVEGILRPTQGVLDTICQSRKQREGKRQLVARLRERAMEVKREEATKAADICRLQDRYEQEDAHDIMVSEHREQMEQIESGAVRKAFQSMQIILESKSVWMGAAARLQGDSELINAALSKIETIHVQAAQSILDRNHDMIQQKEQT